MFLSTNYTFEAFFWIILIAIALVTLTIFFATPKPASKKPQDWDEYCDWGKSDTV